jgi:predicted small integral membrane protein
VDWIGLVQDRYRWWALVNSVMNFRVHKMLGIYRVAAQLVASRVVLSSTELVTWLNDNIKIDLLEIGLNAVDWIGLAQDRYRWRALVNAVMNLRVP